MAVLQAASRLGIKLLEDQVVAHITERIDPATCLEVWKAGDALSLPAVVEAARKCATEAFVEVAGQDAWLGVAAPWLECLLASDELVADKEEQATAGLSRKELEDFADYLKTLEADLGKDELSWKKACVKN